MGTTEELKGLSKESVKLRTENRCYLISTSERNVLKKKEQTNKQKNPTDPLWYICRTIKTIKI